MTEMTDTAPPPPPPPGDGPPSGGWTPPPGGWTPPPGGWPPAGGQPVRRLRRSTTDRVGAGVCGGLGEYFGLDPVIFRVLFAISAFFGIGVVAYLFAWLVIPDASASNPPIDRFIGELRRRGVPLWLVGTVGLFLAWVVLASWWSPWPLVPVALATVVLVIAFNRGPKRDADRVVPPAAVGFPTDRTTPVPVGFPADPAATAPVDLTKPTALYPPTAYPVPPSPAPRSEFSAWIAESRAARRNRRQRNLPVRVATWGLWLLAIAVLSIIDAVHRIPMSVYLWTSLGLIVASLVVGAALRRPVLGFSVALIPLAALLLAFGGTHVSFHDGAGDYTYAPTSVNQLESHYRTAFGQTTLDLSNLAAPTADRTVRVSQAAGQVRILVPRDLAVVVNSDVHAGRVELNGAERHSGVNFNDTVRLGSSTGPALTIDVTLSDGNIAIRSVG